MDQGDQLAQQVEQVMTTGEDFSRSPASPSGGILEIRLTSPAEGERTAPLQRHSWAEIRDSALAGKAPEMDCSLPQALHFAWEWAQPAALPAGLPVTYDLELAIEGGSLESFVFRGLPAPELPVENLRVGTAYSWQVRAWIGSRLLGISPEGHFSTHPALPRWLNVPGITNVRDIGGWPLTGGGSVRQGMIYRGSEMNSHCTITDEGHAVMMQILRIRTDLDLRGVGEERQPVLDTQSVDYVNIPLASYDMIASPEYTGRYRSLFSLLATRAAYPIFMHCWGGADRTGTVAFLLGALLGMRFEDLIHDYELTSLSIWGVRRGDSDAFREMLQTLELFARKGASLQNQAERYLNVIGVNAAEVDAIREIMVKQ